MRNLTKLFTLMLLSVFVLSSCGKYEEGPSFSLASKTSRLANVWQLDAAFLNDTEQTLTAEDKDDYVEFTKDGDYIMTMISSGVTSTMEGTWEWDDTKEYVYSTYSYSFGGTTYSSIDTAKILRLKSNELWVETTTGTDVYEQHFITK